MAQTIIICITMFFIAILICDTLKEISYNKNKEEKKNVKKTR